MPNINYKAKPPKGAEHSQTEQNGSFLLLRILKVQISSNIFQRNQIGRQHRKFKTAIAIVLDLQHHVPANSMWLWLQVVQMQEGI